MERIFMLMNVLERLSKLTSKVEEVEDGIIMFHYRIVNSAIIENYNTGEFVVVDTGLPTSYPIIKEAIEKRYGPGKKPGSILLTHAHFDHIGSLMECAENWDCPVYAHPLEIPYITGLDQYEEADPTVDEGLVAKMSPLFPRDGVNINYQATELPEDGSIPGLPEWKWIHTPGHTRGHICLYRERDAVLIAGDAFTTTKQESLLSVLTQKEEIKGPPAYLTTNWEEAFESVKKLRYLNPRTVIPSHGKFMKGKELREHLDLLVRDFDHKAVPNQGRYINQ